MGCRLMLRDLLLLEVGATEPGDAALVRAEIEQNPNCGRVWEAIQRVSADLNPGRRPINRMSPASFDLDAQVLAAYLDGTLEKEQRKQLEREAIRTPRLLQELLLHFCQHFAENSEAPLPWAVTEKLFLLGGDLENYSAAKPGACLSASTNSALSQSTAFAQPVGIQMAHTVRQTAGPKKASRSRHWMTATAVAVTAGLCGAIWLSGGLSGWLQKSANSNLVSSTTNPKVEMPKVSEGNQQGLDQVDVVAGNLPKRVPTNSSRNGDWALVSLEEPVQNEGVGADTELDPNASVFHQQSSVLEDLAWLKLEGVVALREKGKETWFGPRSSARVFNGWEWQTLPDSWVSARLGKLGEIVLDADTSVTVSVLSPEQLIGLEVQAGRVGLKRLPAQAKLRVKHDRTEWTLEVLSEGTSLGLDWLDGAPRLSVLNGTVRFEEQMVSKGRQLVWTDKAKTGPESFGNTTNFGTLEGSFAWLNNPEKADFLSEFDQAELLASGNVVSSLNRLVANQAPSERVLAQYLPAVLSPEAHLLDVLEGSEQKSREQALQWLMQLSPRSPKTRQVWRTIAEKSGAPEHTREFFRLVQLARNSAPVSELDAKFLTSGLKHDRFFVRELSQLLLEYSFGNTVRYDASAEPAKRNPAADRWTQEVLKSYSITAAPKR